MDRFPERGSADDQAIVFAALAKAALNGDLVNARDDLYKKILETSLGQQLLNRLPNTKASFEPWKLFVRRPVRLMWIAHNLLDQVVRDCHLSRAPELGLVADSFSGDV